MEEIDPAAVRAGYDALAGSYAARLYGELAHKPFDRWWLERFAALVQGRGTVCDLGCGPGQIARYLKDHGVDDVFGADLSEEMVAEARRRNPDIAFRQEDMLAPSLRDGSLAGMAAFYAIVHFTPRQAEQAFREMRRVLAPGGYALVAFHVEELAAPRRTGGHEVRHVDELFGVQASLDFVLHDVDEIASRLRAAGLEVAEITLRYPYPEVEVQTKRAYVLTRRPHPTTFTFGAMSVVDARTILAWRYEGPYAVYNCPPGEIEASVRAWVDPADRYYAIRDGEGALIGYCCFGAEAQVPGGDYTGEDTLDVGLGLQPDLTGQGRGLAFVAAILRFAAQQMRPRRFRLTVAAFNQRAIRVYERAGFRTTHTFVRPMEHGGGEWAQMEREGGDA